MTSPTDDRSSPLSLVLRLIRATPALPPAVAWFLCRALCVAIVSDDAFSLRSAAAPQQLALLVCMARGRRRVVELGTATGWTAAAFALADPTRVVVSCDPHIQPGRDRYLRLLRSSARARIELVHAAGVEAAAMDAHKVDLLFIDSSHERQARHPALTSTLDEPPNDNAAASGTTRLKIRERRGSTPHSAPREIEIRM